MASFLIPKTARSKGCAGDISSDGGQLGRTTFVDNIGANLSQTASGFNGDIFFRYVLTPTANIDFTLAKIGTTISPGYSCLIFNLSSFTITVREDSGSLISTIGPSSLKKIFAKSSGVPDIWDTDESLDSIQANFIYVDSVYGSDISGQKDRIDKPYRTLDTIIPIMSNNDNVFVRPGSYTWTVSNLTPSNASFYFAPGASVSLSGSAALRNFSIYGKADFTSSISVLTRNVEANSFTGGTLTPFCDTDRTVILNELRNSRLNVFGGEIFVGYIKNAFNSFLDKSNSNNYALFVENSINCEIRGNIFAGNTYVEVLNAVCTSRRLILGASDSVYKIHNIEYSHSSACFTINSIQNIVIHVGNMTSNTNILSLINSDLHMTINSLTVSSGTGTVFTVSSGTGLKLDFNEMDIQTSTSIITSLVPVSIRGNVLNIGASSGGFDLRDDSFVEINSINSLSIGSLLTGSGEKTIKINSLDIDNGQILNNCDNTTLYLGNVLITNILLTRFMFLNSSDIYVEFDTIKVLAGQGQLIDVESECVIMGNYLEYATTTPPVGYVIIINPSTTSFKINIKNIRTTVAAPSGITSQIAFATDSNTSSGEFYCDEIYTDNGQNVLVDFNITGPLGTLKFGGRFVTATDNSNFNIQDTVTNLVLDRVSMIANGGVPTAASLTYSGPGATTIQHQGETIANTAFTNTGSGSLSQIGAPLTTGAFT